MVFFSSNLTAFRKEKGLNQEELADLMGISRATVSDYERKRSEPDLSTLLKFAEFFGTSVDQLLRDTGSASKNYSHNYKENERFFKVEEPFFVLGKPSDNALKSSTGKIPVVPTTLFASYHLDSLQPEFVEKLPTLSLPFLSNGNYRAFEIADAGMTSENGIGFYPGDIVVCEYTTPQAIIDGHVYVLVTESASTNNLVVKRCLNRLDQVDAKIWCQSDNKDAAYATFALTLQQIKEVWRFKWKITAHAPDVSTIFDKLTHLESRIKEIELSYKDLRDK